MKLLEYNDFPAHTIQLKLNFTHACRHTRNFKNCHLYAPLHVMLACTHELGTHATHERCTSELTFGLTHYTCGVATSTVALSNEMQLFAAGWLLCMLQ